MRKLTTAILIFLAGSAQAGQQEVADSLKAIDREIVRFRYFATAGSLGFMNVDGTLPAVNSTTVDGVRFNITSAGSSAQAQVALGSILNPGYSGSSLTVAGIFQNTATGAGNDAYNFQGNIGAFGYSVANKDSATTIGSYSIAANLGTSASVFGSVSIAQNGGNSSNLVGVLGLASNIPASGNAVGGYFGLNASTPSFTSSALIADSSSFGVPIFIGRESALNKYMLSQDGNITLGDSAGIASPVSRSISGEPGLGADKVGGSVSIHSGIGTGAGAVSSFQVLTPEAHGSDSTAQTEIISFSRSQKSYSMGDDVVVSLFTVVLPTNNTGCSTHISFEYQATGGGSTVEHAGTAMFAFSNNAGTVTGSVTDSGEVIDGTGCGPGCDTFSVTVAGTTATGKVKFNNTLSVTGLLRYGMIFNTCQSWTRL